MAVSIPRPAFPPPTSALPLLPAPKSRKGVATSPDPTRLPSSSYPSSKLAIRTPSKRLASPTSPTPQDAHTNSTPSIPTLRSLTIQAEYGLVTLEPPRDIRRSVSIASFPQPPKVGRRLPTEPKNLSALPSPVAEPQKRAMENTNTPRILTGSLKARKPNRSTDRLSHLFNPPGNPSLLNGSGDGKAISGAAGGRGSDGLTSLLSPSQSRSSSAQDSYSTSATTFEDVEENLKRAREEAEERIRNSNRLSDAKGAKGNVIVSVRVRPDAIGSGDQTSEGEWMVDGRRSLVSYRGRERGDYYFGEWRHDPTAEWWLT